MIYTVTLNPSIDYLVRVDNFKLGETNRAVDQYIVPGGKGINVSKVLDSFGIPTKLFGFTAGFTGTFIETELRQQGLDTAFVPVKGTTRINVKLKTESETEVNGMSPDISEADVESLQQQIASLASGDTLVLSGSLPGTLPPDAYYKLAAEAKANGVRTVVDTSGEPLRLALQAEPFLIKPNIAELEGLYNERAETIEEVIMLAEKAVQDGAENVLVSRGGQPALLVTADAVLTATIPNGTVKNSVGAGDSMVAGFLYSYEQHQDIEKALQYSTAFGSATAFSQNFVTRESMEQLLPEIQVTHFKKGEKT
ncbi:1-phosphofructokinase [Alkalicoccus halolimnae]|uniref:Tagatose-6-phosphate kinase n=1 Tax=Alkalicoccus halolimnae TaxID=1667239 RepID=A0A5C7FGM8_9BACI|nr:1-phosphofructokinase [Alkalicoccus halolimnae]TXF83923.1 1-phosphofructokinase [Alkalicoccus halolimnae]